MKSAKTCITVNRKSLFSDIPDPGSDFFTSHVEIFVMIFANFSSFSFGLVSLVASLQYVWDGEIKARFL